MSIIGVVLNLMLAGLLAAALALGWRLNQRLKALRDSHDGFAKAVRELNGAAERAEQGLADLRAATDEATEVLADRIDKGRALAAKLERLLQQKPAERAGDPSVERRLGMLLAAARDARARPDRAERMDLDEPLELRELARPAAVARPAQRVRIDDHDLFDDAPVNALGRPALSAIAGGRR